MPFPSHQGTQALIHAMLRALGAAGHDTHLACYAHGVASEPAPYTVHRALATGFTRSLRSGPSLDKLWLDASLLRMVARLVRELAPEVVVAHHVEAAWCARALGIERVLFVAHTSLREELTTYLPRVLSPLLRTLGKQADARLVRSLPRTLAVSPALAALLAADSGKAVWALPLPWLVSSPSDAGERSNARLALALAGDSEVALYAGNLDAYQGLAALLPELSQLACTRPRFRFLVATASPRARLERALVRHGLAERVTFASLESESARRKVYAAADLALIPRECIGGVPIKLLDALARSLPVVATRTALAGMPLERYCSVVERVTPGAFRHAVARAFDTLDEQRTRAGRGTRYLASAHADGHFVEALISHTRTLASAARGASRIA